MAVWKCSCFFFFFFFAVTVLHTSSHVFIILSLLPSDRLQKPWSRFYSQKSRLRVVEWVCTNNSTCLILCILRGCDILNSTLNFWKRNKDWNIQCCLHFKKQNFFSSVEMCSDQQLFKHELSLTPWQRLNAGQFVLCPQVQENLLLKVSLDRAKNLNLCSNNVSTTWKNAEKKGIKTFWQNFLTALPPQKGCKQELNVICNVQQWQEEEV